MEAAVIELLVVIKVFAAVIAQLFGDPLASLSRAALNLQPWMLMKLGPFEEPSVEIQDHEVRLKLNYVSSSVL